MHIPYLSLSQSPADGSPVREGDTVVLTVSSGKVTANKSLSLPKGGVINVKVVLNGEVVKSESVDTNTTTSYNVSVSGDSDNSELAVYLNEVVYYEATIDFTREPAKFTKEKNYEISFYVNVVGLEEVAAVNALNAAGYKNVTVQYEESFEKEGTVIRQTPSHETAPNLDKSATIVLVVSKNQAPDTTTLAPTPTPDESNTDTQLQ